MQPLRLPIGALLVAPMRRMLPALAIATVLACVSAATGLAAGSTQVEHFSDTFPDDNCGEIACIVVRVIGVEPSRLARSQKRSTAETPSSRSFCEPVFSASSASLRLAGLDFPPFNAPRPRVMQITCKCESSR